MDEVWKGWFQKRRSDDAGAGMVGAGPSTPVQLKLCKHGICPGPHAAA